MICPGTCSELDTVQGPEQLSDLFPEIANTLEHTESSVYMCQHEVFCKL